MLIRTRIRPLLQRYMIRRRRRARFVNSERADATRRGEEGELPTYGETSEFRIATLKSFLRSITKSRFSGQLWPRVTRLCRTLLWREPR